MKVGRIGLSHFSQPKPLDPVPDLLLDVQKVAMEREYATGVKDGFRITLELLLGRPSSGGMPYSGPIPDELRAWAETALDKLAPSPSPPT